MRIQIDVKTYSLGGAIATMVYDSVSNA